MISGAGSIGNIVDLICGADSIGSLEEISRVSRFHEEHGRDEQGKKVP